MNLKDLPPAAIRFLNNFAKDIAMIVCDRRKMEYFRAQVTQFADKRKAFTIVMEADKKGKWQPAMGRPTDPMGVIWPHEYGTGWKSLNDFGGGLIPLMYKIYEDAPELLGHYTLLAEIHDRSLPQCDKINNGCMPSPLADEIWCNLRVNRDKLNQSLEKIKKDLANQFDGVDTMGKERKPKTNTADDSKDRRILQVETEQPDVLKTDEATQELAGATGANISGIAWQDAKTTAEKYVTSEGFPGITKLAAIVGCVQNTMRKAINSSIILQQAEKKHKKKNKKTSPPTVGLSEKIEAIKECNSTSPDEEADVALLMKKKNAEQLRTDIVELSMNMNASVRKTDETVPILDKENLTSELAGNTHEELARMYISLREEVSEIHRDDPEKPGQKRQA
jgi:hypothetical protein